MLLWFDVLAPAIVTVLLIRADARLVGPYWAFSQLLPGVGSIYADLYAETSPFTGAVLRRFMYAVVPGVYVGIRYDALDPLTAAVPGAVTFFLVLWPIVFHGLPPVRARHLLVAMYGLLLLVFGSLSALAFGVTEFVQAQARDIGEYVAREGIELVVELVVLAFAGSILRIVWAALRRRNAPGPPSGYEVHTSDDH